MRFSLLFILIFAVLSNISIFSQEIDLSKPLNQENYQKWDEFIKKNAPSQAAINVVANIANRHYFAGRYAVAREVYKIYKKYFPNDSLGFDNQININEELMLTVPPQSDMNYLYIAYINEKAPDIKAFVALQRLTDVYVERKEWDSLSLIYKAFKPKFPNLSKRFDKTIALFEAKEKQLQVNNLGKLINTAYDEWDPTPTPDGKALFFSARNFKNTFGNSDVYISYFDTLTNTWKAPINAGRKINGQLDETIDNVSADGNTLLLSGDFEGTYGKFDIYTIDKDSTGFGSLKHLPMPVNSPDVDEGALLTADSKVIMFSSDRPGGIGEYVPFLNIYNGSSNGNMDIYLCIKTDSGWSKPINLGPVINTPFSERSPYLHPDGKTLYFSSEGHYGLGRLDVFKSTRLSDTSWTQWSEPINLGKEINSSQDDWGYTIALSGDSAFFSARATANNYGGLDIYSISLPQKMKPEKVVTIKGKITDANNKPLAAVIKWEDLSNGQNIGSLKSNPIDGSFIIILPLGKNYGFYAEKDGYYPASSNIDLRKSKDKAEIIKNIKLASKYQITEEKVKLIIQNVFFDYNKYKLKEESFPELKRLIEFLKPIKYKKLIVEGHTDEVGSDEFNLKLSQQRADAVKLYLISLGLDKEKITSIGKGKKFPISKNKGVEAQALNRRVEISIE